MERFFFFVFLVVVVVQAKCSIVFCTKKALHSALRQNDARVTFAATLDGDYSICFSINFILFFVCLCC
jgi:hypothetical protein